ncbi:hypothetical protein Vretifemale_9394 [Volvox reticuliferus]|uniref:F5/8 type C domain-containing protein n=1 Tax=Volvox reticuliferus TaxID=1737510 RepID=A0A8J4CIF7_9CHLO|nr:hypothetical protein Vretifemale_9394 [Volvox reticuliferus]
MVRAGNLAVGKSAFSSGGYYPASWAVDGNITTIASTYPDESNRWLSIDLGASYDISRIVLWNDDTGTCCYDELLSSEIRVGPYSITSQNDVNSYINKNTLVRLLTSSSIGNGAGQSYSIDVYPPVRGRWITIKGSGYYGNSEFLYVLLFLSLFYEQQACYIFTGARSECYICKIDAYRITEFEWHVAAALGYCQALNYKMSYSAAGWTSNKGDHLCILAKSRGQHVACAKDRICSRNRHGGGKHHIKDVNS